MAYEGELGSKNSWEVKKLKEERENIRISKSEQAKA
jgi:hypothetical protein